MPTTALTPTRYYRQQARTAQRAAARAVRTWAAIDQDAIGPSWRDLLPVLLAGVTDDQVAAAAGAASAPLLADQPPAGLVPSAFAGRAADGRGLDTLLQVPVITTLRRISDGAAPRTALRAGALQLVQIIRSEVTDAGRLAGHAAIADTPAIVGYERIVVPPACTRCVVLAGRLYPWTSGFRRHPRCDCQHRAVTRQQWREQGRSNTPQQLLDAMTADQRRKGGLTAADEQALSQGADLNQLVNARRGAAGMAPPGARTTGERLALQDGRTRGRVTPVRLYGRDVYVTTEGTTTRGLAGQRLGARRDGVRLPGERYGRARAPRLLPQQIFTEAGSDRDLARRLLHTNGYIL